MADTLSLLFQLDADGRPAVAEFQRVRKAFAGEIAALRKTVAQSFTLPPIKLPTTAQATGQRSNQVDAHVKEFRRIEAEAAKSSKAQEKEQQRLNAAVESLQRQRTAALVRAFKEEERAAAASAKAQERALAASFKAQERAAIAAAKAQEQAARQAAARLARTPQSDQQVRDFRRIEAERQKAARAAEVATARSARAQEREERRKNSAITALDRQRSAAFLAQRKIEERAAVASARAQERAAQQAARAIANAFRGIGPSLQSVGRTLTIGITAPLLALGAASLKSARDLDANVNTLKAFTGSAEAAEARLAQLIKTARDTPGLTTNLALTLDAQLRVAKTTEETINRVLPAIGRLNAVSKLPDAGRFTQNLLQLITQNFERQDLKELVGQSPIAGQLITEIFNVDSPINAKAIRESAKRLGINSVDAFFAAFADAAARNQGLATVTESIGTRFDKLVDRVQVALRPLGLSIINAIEPFVEPVAKLVERVGAAFDSLSTPVKTAIIVIAGLAAATGPVLFLMGSLLQTIGQIVPALVTLNAVGLLPTLTNLRLIRQVMAGTASLAAGAKITALVAAGGWVAVGVAIAAAAVGAAIAIRRWATAEEELVKVSVAQIRATSGQVKSLREQLTFVNGLQSGVARTATEQERLKRIYADLNPESRARVDVIKDETGRLAELRTELQRLLTLRTEEQRIQAATLSANLDQTIRQADQTEAAIERATQRINDLSRAREALERSASPLSREEIEALRLPDLFGLGRDQQLQFLEQRIKSLIKLQDDLRKKADELNGTAREQSEALKSLAEQTGLTERQILVQARAMGLLKTDVDAALKSIEAYRARQGDAAATTKEGTKEIDEQTKSLKELKRALKEAEIATRERSAATRRAFEEDKISSQEATRQLIADARALAAAQVKEIDETLEAKRKSLKGADEETAEKTRDEIAQLELDKKRIISETAIEVADLQVQQRRRERDGETEHQSTLIEIRRTSAEQQIDGLRDRIEREESFRLDGERQIVVIERRVTQAEEDEIRRRLDLVAEGTEARRRLEDELSRFIENKARQRAEQARRLARTELDNALLPVRRSRLREGAENAADAGVISRLQNIADEGRTSFEATERQVGKIIDDGFARRIKRLSEEIVIRNNHNQDVSQLNAELQALEQERQNAAEETDRATEQGRQTDLDRARSYRDRLASIYSDVAEITLELRQRVVDALRRGLAPERQIIDEENNLAIAREELRHTQVTGVIQENIDRLEALAKKRALNAQELKELKAHRQALKAESDLNRSNQEETERQRRVDLERANPNSTRSLFGDTFANFGEAIRAAAAAADVAISNLSVTLGSFGAAAAEHFAAASASAGNFISILLDGIDQINAGLADMLQNWILTGDTGSGALRKLLASTLAYYSRTFLIKALDNVGEGFSNLAKASAAAAAGNFISAALYKHAAVQNFVSAAKYGIASAATAVAGRFAAGDSFKQDTARRGVSGGFGDSEPRNATFNFGGQGPVESSSRAARDGSGGFFGGLTSRIEAFQQQVLDLQRQQQLQNAQVAQTLTKLGTARPGDVVTIGSQERPDAIGIAVIDHSNGSGDFNEALQRNLGFA